jgi:hypothetical protein
VHPLARNCPCSAHHYRVFRRIAAEPVPQDLLASVPSPSGRARTKLTIPSAVLDLMESQPTEEVAVPQPTAQIETSPAPVQPGRALRLAVQVTGAAIALTVAALVVAGIVHPDVRWRFLPESGRSSSTTVVPAANGQRGTPPDQGHPSLRDTASFTVHGGAKTRPFHFGTTPSIVVMGSVPATPVPGTPSTLRPTTNTTCRRTGAARMGAAALVGTTTTIPPPSTTTVPATTTTTAPTTTPTTAPPTTVVAPPTSVACS